MPPIGSLSYGTAALTFLALTALLATAWRGRMQGALLVLACGVSAVWAAVAASQVAFGVPSAVFVFMFEAARDLGLLMFVGALVRSQIGADQPFPAVLRTLLLGAYVLPITLLVILVIATVSDLAPQTWLGYDARILLSVFIAIVGLVLLEQVYKRSPPDLRWGIKFLCIGVGGIFAYDLALYTDALLFKQIDGDLWFARGFVDVALIPLIAISIARNPQWSLEVFVSRGVVFHSTALLLAGAYLLVIALGGYYLRVFGGDWGAVARNAFVFVGLLGMIIAVFSGQMRARLRVFINKHFFSSKYDYRQEWLRLIRTLSLEANGGALEERAIRAVAEMVDSPAGGLWVRRGPHHFAAVQSYTRTEFGEGSEPADGALPRFLQEWQWVINLEEYGRDPLAYEGLVLPLWLRGLSDAWLVVPLMLQAELYGFLVLANPRAKRDFNWEDIDLLKTAGRQVAIHLAQARSASDLAQARQFEAFNRLSAYVVHDLKNLVSQLALVVKNAEKHKHNPAFMDDAIRTVDNAVGRMTRLLAQLRAGGATSERKQRVELASALNAVIHEKANGKPAPTLEAVVKGLYVEADHDRLVSVIGHIVQNAQDATPDSGHVKLKLETDGALAVIQVTDSGSGMDQNFIETRLFKPFDTTKGLSGMGIGAYEAKEFIEHLGGTVQVTSAVGVGTTFRLRFPVVIGG